MDLILPAYQETAKTPSSTLPVHLFKRPCQLREGAQKAPKSRIPIASSMPVPVSLQKRAQQRAAALHVQPNNSKPCAKLARSYQPTNQITAKHTYICIYIYKQNTNTPTN